VWHSDLQRRKTLRSRPFLLFAAVAFLSALFAGPAPAGSDEIDLLRAGWLDRRWKAHEARIAELLQQGGPKSGAKSSAT
jgi:hypothetical protein